MIGFATQNNESEVYQLICILENKQMNREHFNKSFSLGLKDSNVYFIVYKEKNEIVGFMSLYIQSYLHHDQDTAEITEAVVHPNYRSQGIGRKMLAEAECLASKRKVEEIALSSSFFRKEAHQFYERENFIKDHYYFTKKLKI